MEMLEKMEVVPSPPPAKKRITRFTEEDIKVFRDGGCCQLYEKFGAHQMTVDGVEGVYFSVWAPNAKHVSVIGEFNGWNSCENSMQPIGEAGVWEGFVPLVKPGALYKYHIVSRHNDYRVDKADPFAFLSEKAPNTASVVWNLDHRWKDESWMELRGGSDPLKTPISIYEVHLGSWSRVPEEGNRFLTYREMAPKLADYVLKLGFTHVELLPITEHPFYGSWGYQTTGYFAPTSRYGKPQDLMYLIDYLHQKGIGVILDWVPLHFPKDAHGLSFFDGTHLYEHADPRKGYHLEWKSAIFNYERREVWSFLLSNALFWLDKYHIDGMRVDAVSFMVYLDHSKKPGEWAPNIHGGRENLEAINFLRWFNDEVAKKHPDVFVIAEESTDRSKVSHSSKQGGLGFGMKWDMGWMNDTLVYMQKPPHQRKAFHQKLTFRMLYAFHENFTLALSHDEMAHGKGSLLRQMGGNDQQKFGGLRALFGYMFGQPGKKLLFMGSEFAQWRDWNHDQSLDWHLLSDPRHAGMQKWVSDLNNLYRSEPALHELDCHPAGFEWVDCHDANNSVIDFVRKPAAGGDMVLVICNFSGVTQTNYRIGMPRGGFWKEILNSDAREYGGHGLGNFGGVHVQKVQWHNRQYSVALTLPPLSALFFMSRGIELNGKA